MYSIFKSLEVGYKGNDDCAKVAEYLIAGLKNELATHHKTADLASAPVTSCDFILAGFDEGDVSKPNVSSHLVFSGTMKINRQTNDTGHF